MAVKYDVGVAKEAEMKSGTPEPLQWKQHCVVSSLSDKVCRPAGQ